MIFPRRIGAVLCLVLALALPPALAGPAWAGQKSGLMRFEPPASNGYRIFVYRHEATVSVSVVRTDRRRHASAVTTYIARAEPGANGIRADFGSLGRVSMRFKPSGQVLHGKPERECTGPNRTTTRPGVFVGSLRFRGEGGYVSTDVHRAKGELINPASLRCAGPATHAHQTGRTPKQSKRTFLEARFRLGVVATYFEAETGGTRKTHYSAYSEETSGQVAISHYATAFASPQTFSTDDPLSFADLTPPAPFSGTGSLQRNANGSRTWSGSLAVSFPGDPDAPLTGPRFKTQLTRGW